MDDDGSFSRADSKPSEFGGSLGISAPTVNSFMEILEKTFMAILLYPFQVNIKKRLVKTPKIYIRDTGIIHSLLQIDSANSLMGHHVFGQSWESYAIEQIVSNSLGWRLFYYRTSDGTEIDLLLIRGQRKIAVECKASTSPNVSAGFFNCVDDLKIDEAFIASALEQSEVYPNNRTAKVASLDKIIEALK